MGFVRLDYRISATIGRVVLVPILGRLLPVSYSLFMSPTYVPLPVYPNLSQGPGFVYSTEVGVKMMPWAS